MIFVFFCQNFLSHSASVVILFYFFKGFVYMNGKLRVSETGRERPGGFVEVRVNIDLDLVVVTIISSYFIIIITIKEMSAFQRLCSP